MAATAAAAIDPRAAVAGGAPRFPFSPPRGMRLPRLRELRDVPGQGFMGPGSPSRTAGRVDSAQAVCALRLNLSHRRRLHGMRLRRCGVHRRRAGARTVPREKGRHSWKEVRPASHGRRAWAELQDSTLQAQKLTRLQRRIHESSQDRLGDGMRMLPSCARPLRQAGRKPGIAILAFRDRHAAESSREPRGSTPTARVWR